MIPKSKKIYLNIKNKNKNDIRVKKKNAIGDYLFFIFLREAIKANLNHYSPLERKLNGN